MSWQKQYGVLISLVMAVLAIITHAYLSNNHYLLQLGLSQGDSMCNINATFNCDIVAASPFSKFLGFPVALWGLVVNAVFFILAAGYWMTDENDSNHKTFGHLAFLFITIIAAASLVMGVISSTAVKSLCIFCIATWVFSFVGYYFFAQTGITLKDSLGSLMAHTKALPAYVLGSLIAVPVGVYLGHAMSLQGHQSKNFDKIIKNQVMIWQSSPDFPVDANGGLEMGAPPEAAKVTIIEFADFNCIHCLKASPIIKTFVKSQNDVRLVFKSFPLDGECNKAIPSKNGASCRLAKAAFCANKKNKGWEVHDFFFDNFGQFRSVGAIDPKLEGFSKEIGLDWNELKACIDSDETHNTVAAMADQGVAAQVQGTPALYINGKKVGNQSLNIGVLQAIRASVLNR